MHESPLAAHASTPTELQERLEAERAGQPFLVLRDPSGGQILISLAERVNVTIGRRPESDLPLPWDTQVSRLHAELQRVGGDWVVIDDGLSTNGTWLGETRLTGRTPLRNGDLLRIGGTVIAFCAPRSGESRTALADDMTGVTKVTPAQKRVLLELCRPALEGQGLAAPPTNHQLAQTLFLSVDAVKSHMRALFDAFGLDGVPQAQKRAALIERAVAIGLVTRRDFRAKPDT